MIKLQNIDKKWILWIALSIVLGFISGELVAYLLKMVFVGVIAELIISLMVPAFIIIFLLFTLYSYNREKEDTIG